jgi:CRP-like cAMP-binding protein
MHSKKLPFSSSWKITKFRLFIIIIIFSPHALQLEQFAGFFHQKRFRKGETIIQQGEKTDTFFIISEGVVEFSYRQDLIDPGSPSTVLGKKRDGDFFGVTSPRDAQISAIAIEKTLCLTLSVPALQKFIRLSPDHAQLIQQVTSHSFDNIIRQVPWLEHLPDEQVALFRSLSKHLPLKPGQVLFEENDLGTTLYIVIHGHVSAFKMDEDGNEVKASEFGPGAYFGEVLLLFFFLLIAIYFIHYLIYLLLIVY